MADRVTRSVVIDRGADELFRLWVQYEAFPKFMRHIRSVVKTGPGTSHWVMRGSMGRDLEWDARVLRVEPGRSIWWESIRGDLSTRGHVAFRPLEPGRTEVTVSMQYEPKESILSTVGSLLADPGGDLDDDLRNLKAFAEREASRQPGGEPFPTDLQGA